MYTAQKVFKCKECNCVFIVIQSTREVDGDGHCPYCGGYNGALIDINNYE